MIKSNKEAGLLFKFMKEGNKPYKWHDWKRTHVNQMLWHFRVPYSYQSPAQFDWDGLKHIIEPILCDSTVYERTLKQTKD